MTHGSRPDVSVEKEDGASPAGLREDDNDTDAERRVILARLGKMAALTPPAVVTLLISTRASAESPPPDPPEPPPIDPNP